MNRYSTYENETLQCPVLDSLFLVKNLKRTLYQKFELFQSCQNFYKCDNNENYFKFEISYLSNSHINNSANFNVRMSKIFDLMGKNILSMARFEFPGNDEIELCFRQNALLRVNLFFNSEVLNRESYFNIVYEVFC